MADRPGHGLQLFRQLSPAVDHHYDDDDDYYYGDHHYNYDAGSKNGLLIRYDHHDYLVNQMMIMMVMRMVVLGREVLVGD